MCPDQSSQLKYTVALGQSRKYTEKPDEFITWDLEGLDTDLEDVVRMERCGFLSGSQGT